MVINELLEQNNMTMYRLSQNSNVPYTTLNDICNGKTNLEKCSAETVYRLAKELHVSMEELLEPCLEPRCSFELFKSNVCHKLKTMGDIDFLIDTLQSNEIRSFYNKKWYPESFYLLAMVDYISRMNDIPLCDEYNDLRTQKLNEVIYPAGVIALSEVLNDERLKAEALKNALPEFIRFNIVENEVYNVI